MNRLLTLREVATLLRVSPSRVSRLRDLPRISLGKRSPRFREEDVAAFIESRRVVNVREPRARRGIKAPRRAPQIGGKPDATS